MFFSAAEPPTHRPASVNASERSFLCKLTYCDGRVDALHVALLHQHLERALAQRLDLALLERLAVFELLNPAVEVAAARHLRFPHRPTALFRRRGGPLQQEQ
jgi:hypothetical protein